MNFFKTLYYRWRLALASARLQRAGATGDVDAVAKAVAEFRVLVRTIALRCDNHRVRWAAAAVERDLDLVIQPEIGQ